MWMRGRGCSTSTATWFTPRAQAVDGRIDQLGDVGALVEDVHRAGLETAHVQEVLHQGVQTVGFVVDGLEQDPGLVGSELELVGEQAGRRRLDRSQRCAEVVAHSGQQRRPQLVGPGQGVGLGRFGVEAVTLQGGGQLGRERGQDLAVLGG